MENATTENPAQEVDVQAQIDKIVEKADKTELASIKSVVLGVVRIINDPHSTIKDLKEIIEIDPPLTAKVLTVANSVYYGTPRRINAIDQAVVWIGFDALKEITLNQKVCEIYHRKTKIEDYSRLLLWRHSVATALLGKMIYRREFRQRGENVYAAGLIHDIGMIVEDQFCEDEFAEVLKRMKKENLNMVEVEREVLGFDHGDLGKAISTHWNLPPDLILSIGHHHDPRRVDHNHLRMAMTLFLANYLVQQAGIGFVDSPQRNHKIFNHCMEALKLNESSLNLIVKDMKDEFAKLEDQGFF